VPTNTTIRRVSHTARCRPSPMRCPGSPARRELVTVTNSPSAAQDGSRSAERFWSVDAPRHCTRSRRSVARSRQAGWPSSTMPSSRRSGRGPDGGPRSCVAKRGLTGPCLAPRDARAEDQRGQLFASRRYRVCSRNVVAYAAGPSDANSRHLEAGLILGGRPTQWPVWVNSGPSVGRTRRGRHACGVALRRSGPR